LKQPVDVQAERGRFGEITIGSVTVRARWRYSYLQAAEGEGKPLQGTAAREDLNFIAVLSIAERKKLASLKQGDWTRLTASPFVDMPVCLKEINTRTAMPAWPRLFSSPSAGSRCSSAYRTLT
jgi:hypothetical protein